MSIDTAGKFTLTWNISLTKLFRLGIGESMQCPSVEAENLNGTKWYLKLFLILPDGISCELHRNVVDKSDNIFITVTSKLEIIDSNEKTLKSATTTDVSFAKGSFHKVADFLTPDFLVSLRNHRSVSDTVTIRCHLIDESYKKQVMNWDVPTVIQSQWKINASFPSNWSKKLKFPCHEYTHIDITLFASNEMINIDIGRVSFVQPYKLKIRVLNSHNQKVDFKDVKHSFHSTDNYQLFQTWFNISQLKGFLSSTYSFTLICTISIGNSASEIESYSLGFHPIAKSLGKAASRLPLQEDLNEMIMKEKHSDVKIRVHDEIIPAHKCLLSARSPVFSAMFDQNMSETQTGIVDIPDVESETLRLFLEFLYTDIIASTKSDDVLKLLVVADKYQVTILKERCSLILMFQISLENVCEMISVSDIANQPNLKQCAINYIKRNKTTVISSRVWSDWVEKNMKLAVEVLTKTLIE